MKLQAGADLDEAIAEARCDACLAAPCECWRYSDLPPLPAAAIARADAAGEERDELAGTLPRRLVGPGRRR